MSVANNHYFLIQFEPTGAALGVNSDSFANFWPQFGPQSGNPDEVLHHRRSVDATRSAIVVQATFSDEELNVSTWGARTAAYFGVPAVAVSIADVTAANAGTVPVGTLVYTVSVTGVLVATVYDFAAATTLASGSMCQAYMASQPSMWFEAEE